MNYHVKMDVAIVIPVYKTALDSHEQFSVDYLITKAPGRKLFFIAPRSLERSYYSERYGAIEFKFFDDANFSSIIGYNHLLLDTAFYEAFSAFDYILIHQTDALLFNDNLDYWMGREFDYIGAPWVNGIEINLQLGKFAVDTGVNLKAYVGNGGFSLRSVESTLKVLEEFRDIKENWIKCGSSEDLFFAFMGMISDSFRIPNQIIASRFSMESGLDKYFKFNDSQIPTGCHAWYKHNLEFWEQLIERANNDFSVA